MAVRNEVPNRERRAEGFAISLRSLGLPVRRRRIVNARLQDIVNTCNFLGVTSEIIARTRHLPVAGSPRGRNRYFVENGSLVPQENQTV